MKYETAFDYPLPDCLNYTVKIAKLNIDSPTFLAPMAGYTDSPFRQLCKKMGAAVVFTEFVSSEGVIRESEKTFQYLSFTASERPLGIQLFGYNPQSMADAAAIIEERYKPNIIDLNFGCSVRKVVRKNAGAALLKDLPRLESIAKSVIKAVQTPVTAKIRAGWDRRSIVAREVAKILENAGIAALTIHPRTASDGYRNKADWKLIAEVKSIVSVPVIGNGDIYTPEDAQRMEKMTGCDAVMIGRAAIGNPWIFKQIAQLRSGKNDYILPGLAEKIAMCIQHIELEKQVSDEHHVNRIMKKFYRHYIHGFPNAAEIRNRLVHSSSLEQTMEILRALQNSVKNDRSAN